MAERRHPPSARRRALARRSGAHAASEILVGGVACACAVVAVVHLAHGTAAELGAWIARACATRLGSNPFAPLGVMLAFAATIVIAPAVGATIAHVAQTRTLWLPRRRVAGAPVMPRALGTRAAFDLACLATVAAVAVGWLWLVAPEIARAGGLDDTAALVARFIIAIAIAWVVLGVVHALARNAALETGLAMTDAEQREDARLAAADPRWQARRREAARAPSLVGAALVVLGDDVAIAIAWHPSRQPVPTRAAIGRGVRATELIALARRDGVAIHRDHALAATLASAHGPVAEHDWPRLAELVAASRRRD